MYLHDGEPIGQALRRFQKLVERHGVVWEQRWRDDFVPQTQFRRVKKFRKRFQARRATLVAQRAGVQPVASLTQAIAQFWQRTGKP